LTTDKVKPGRWQSRRHFEPEAFAELADSIDQHGVIQPIVVSFDVTDGLYEIIAGERRWWAAMQAGLYQVPVVIYNDIPIKECYAINLIENT
jgi:ParB family chromosome partitioning protein